MARRSRSSSATWYQPKINFSGYNKSTGGKAVDKMSTCSSTDYWAISYNCWQVSTDEFFFCFPIWKFQAFIDTQIFGLYVLYQVVVTSIELDRASVKVWNFFLVKIKATCAHNGKLLIPFSGQSPATTAVLVVIYATIMLISKLYVLYYCCSCDLSKKRGFTVLSC